MPQFLLLSYCAVSTIYFFSSPANERVDVVCRLVLRYHLLKVLITAASTLPTPPVTPTQLTLCLSVCHHSFRQFSSLLLFCLLFSSLHHHYIYVWIFFLRLSLFIFSRSVICCHCNYFFIRLSIHTFTLFLIFTCP